MLGLLDFAGIFLQQHLERHALCAGQLPAKKPADTEPVEKVPKTNEIQKAQAHPLESLIAYLLCSRDSKSDLRTR